MWIPGFGTEELRPFKRNATTEAHKQRMADSMLYEVISNLKRKHATTTKRAEKLVPRTQCGVIPEGGRLPHPRPAAQPDQLPLPAHTAFSCPKPFTWFEVKLFTT